MVRIADVLKELAASYMTELGAFDSEMVNILDISEEITSFFFMAKLLFRNSKNAQCFVRFFVRL